MTDSVWEALREKLADAFPVVFLTALAFTDDGATMERIYSSHPEQYPVGGRKSVANDVHPEWVAVASRRGTVLAPTTADVERIFGDAALIRSLGGGSLMNVALVDAAGAHWGSVNIIGPDGAYDRGTARTAEEIVHQFAHTIERPVGTSETGPKGAA